MSVEPAHHTTVAPMPFPTPGRTTAVPGAPSIDQLNRAATELLPYLRAEAQATEQARRVSGRTTAMFREAGFFKLMQPARYGGYEYGFTAFVDIVSELARACTSSGWGCSLGAVHQWMIGTFQAEAQDDVWGRDPNAIACVSYAPTVTAERAPGGWKIQGQWHWASNVDNSQWAILGVQFPSEDKAAPPSAGFLLVPRSDWRVEDNWFVAGQSGTGSKAVAIDSPVFVPEHRRLSFAQASSGQPPGAAHNTNPLYRIPFLSAVPTCLAAPLLGTAQGAVDAFIDLCGNRITRGAVAGGGNRLSQFFPVQSRVAEAAACVDAARLLMYRDTAEVEQLAIDGKTVDVATRIRNRRDHAFSARLSQQAVEAVFSAVGGGGLALDQPLQRMWRDANAIVRHISLNWDAVSSMTGQFMLGLEPKGQY